MDGVCIGGEHDQAVEAEGDAGAGGESAGDCGGEGGGAGELGLGGGLSAGVLVGFAAAEFGGIGEFLVAVAEFKSADVEFEAAGDWGGGVGDDGECGL